MIIRIVAAMGKNRAIGKNNKMPWHLPDDLKHFREVTEGKPVIMGRKTYQSIGRPLPNRKNIVVTRNPDFHAEGCMIISSLEKAVEIAGAEHPQEICIIGGAQIYAQSLPFATHLSLTIIKNEFGADAYFPEFNKTEWKEVSREEHPRDEEHEFSFDFVEYKRK